MKSYFKIRTQKIIWTIIAVFVAATICIGFNHISNVKNSSAVSSSEAQQMVREVALAYYRRGASIQYEGRRRNAHISPEQITDYTRTHHVCSGFTQAVYYEAFGMFIPPTAQEVYSYATARYKEDEHKDVVFAGDNPFYNLDKNSQDYKKKYKEILKQLQIGDIIYWGPGKITGHVMIVYDFKTDGNGNKTDVILIDSGGAGTIQREKEGKILGRDRKAILGIKSNLYITQGTTPDYYIPEGELYPDARISIASPGAYAGTIQLNRASFANKDNQYFVIYRPLAYITEGKYRKYNDKGAPKVSISGEKLKVSQKRLNYSGIRIYKNVKKYYNGGVVQQGETLEYIVRVENMSNKAYAKLKIQENVPTDLVDVENLAGGTFDGKTITWDNISIPSNQYKEIVYSVKVKTGSNLDGKEIKSTGLVAEKIPSTTVINRIGHNPTAEQQNSLLTSYNQNKNSYKGLELIDKTYKDVYGDKYTLDLAHLELGAYYNIRQDILPEKAKKCNPYIKDNKENADDSTALIVAISTNAYGGMKGINKNHPLAKAVLNNYYNALYQYYDEKMQGCTDVGIINYTNNKPMTETEITPTTRSDTIYPQTLKKGDVLVYSNKPFTADQLKNKDTKEIFGDKNIQEDGTFAYIWDGEKFIGNNNGHDIKSGTDDDGETYNFNQDEIKGTTNVTRSKEYINSLGLLFSKDFYVILRPSLLIDTRTEPTIRFASASITKKTTDTAFTNKTTYSGNGTLTYVSSNTNVATVNQATGSVTIKGAGTTNITVTASETDTYLSGSATYKLTINKDNQKITFSNTSANIDKNIGDSSFSNTATTNGDGVITYSSSNMNVATVNSNTGEITIISTGKTTITANVSETNKFKSASASFTLIVKGLTKQEQIVTFAISGSIIKTYGDASFTNLATTSGDGPVTYISTNPNIAEVDESTGAISIISAGTTQIIATASETAIYNPASNSFTLTVDKKASKVPTETSNLFNGLIGEKISSIILNTEGLEWANAEEIIRSGDNIYAVTYTENSDTSNYTTENYSITVHGSSKIYPFIVGDKQKIMVNNDFDASFIIDADYNLFENGGKVYINSELLSRDNYQSSSGSTVISLNNNYVSELDEGIYNMTVQFNDEGVANTSFEIIRDENEDGDGEGVADDPEDYAEEDGDYTPPTPPVNPDEPAINDSEEEIVVPNTGFTNNTTKENANIGDYIMLIITIAIAEVSLFAIRRLFIKKRIQFGK